MDISDLMRQEDTDSKCHLVVIQPTPFCNINCRYCYLPNRLSTKRISQDTLSKVIKALFDEDLVTEETEILWHASEPLVMPVDFYRETFALIDQINKGRIPLRHRIQTNATLIDEDWCQLFREFKIDVGVSIDGPQHIHDRSRVDRNGRGTFERVWRGVNLLQKHDIPFHVICVVTDYSLDYVDEIFNFFVENRISDIGFNTEEVTGVNTQSSLGGANSEEKCFKFFKRLLELQKSVPHQVSIREFSYISQRVLLAHQPVSLAVTTPFKILSFDIDGNFSTFCPELLSIQDKRFGNFIYGNIHRDTIRSLTDHQKFQTVYREIRQGIAACSKTCEYFQVCGGGNPSNKISEKGTFATTETMYCKSKIKTVSDIVVEELSRVVLSPAK